MEKSEIIERKIREEEDFVYAPKFGNSLNKLLAKSENLLKNEAIGRALLLKGDQVEVLYLESVEELKKGMVDDDGGRS